MQSINEPRKFGKPDLALRHEPTTLLRPILPIFPNSIRRRFAGISRQGIICIEEMGNHQEISMIASTKYYQTFGEPHRWSFRHRLLRIPARCCCTQNFSPHFQGVCQVDRHVDEAIDFSIKFSSTNHDNEHPLSTDLLKSK